LASPSREVGLRAFVDAYDLVLCDVFGTLHDETGIFPDAIEALVRFRDSGRVVILLSNSAYPGAALADHLTSRGVPASAFDAIVTSAESRARSSPAEHVRCTTSALRASACCSRACPSRSRGSREPT
jgi:ribonucleotide monophosphatase NagD (HAD superfamily)